MNNEAPKRKPASPRVIGLDIGATNCRVSSWSTKLGKPERVWDELGNSCIPSVVAVTETGVLVGHGALGLLTKDQRNVFTGIRDLLKENPEGKRLKVDINGEDTAFSPQDILTHLLAKLRDIVHGQFGTDVVDTVLAVPVWLSDAGRQAVRNACTGVGLNPLRVINEATSACIAYNYDLHNKFEEETTVLVFDMGGSTFNVSILLIEDGIIEITHTVMHSDVCGNKFDERLADFLITEHDKKNKSNLRDDGRIMRRMRTACCKAKECLSSSSYTNILIEHLQNDKDYKNSVTKATFEKLNLDLFRSAMDMVEGALKDAHAKKEDIQRVMMAGGSTKIPKLAEMVKDMFPGRIVEGSITPEDVVSFGCASQAMVLTGHAGNAEKLTDLLLLDVEPLSLGLETAENVMAVLIPRNATIPSRRTMTFTTYHDNQVTMMFRVFEGDRRLTTGNRDIGMFEMTAIRAEPRGRARIDVTFDLDANGVLTITALNRFSGKSQSCSMTNFKSYYDQGELEDIIEIAEETKESDDKKVSVLISKLCLISFIANLESAMEKEDGINDNVKETVMTKCRETKDWIAKQESSKQSMYEEKMSLLENDICSLSNRDLVTQCRNDRLQFISGRVVDTIVTKSGSLSMGWRKGRAGRSTRSTPVVTVPTYSAPAVDVEIEAVD